MTAIPFELSSQIHKHSLTHPLAHTHSLSLTHSSTHLIAHSIIYSLTLFSLSLSLSAMSSDRNKEMFLQQVQQILDGIKKDRDKVTSPTVPHINIMSFSLSAQQSLS